MSSNSSSPQPSTRRGRGVVEETVRSMARALGEGATTPSRLLEEHLEVIAAREAEVQAWCHLDAQGARERARALDARPATSALHGIPFGLKDNIDTCDMPTAYGSAIHAGCRPVRDAACVALLRLAGANPLGKTVSAEFAHKAPGPTRNPHHPGHTPGGSSSGSAAAVAAGMVPFALGTQTTGSVIRPAAYCGVVGYKPTYCHLSLAGVLDNAPSFDTLGLMARAVEDVALVRRALLDDSVSVPAPAALAGARIGVCRAAGWEGASAEARRLMEDTERALEAAGARLGDFDGGGALAGLEDANRVVSGYEFARVLAHERRCASERLSAVLREGRMADGLRATHGEWVAAQRRLERARIEMDAAFEQVDAVLCLPAPGAAPQGLGSTGEADCNLAWTTLHTPAVTLPVGRDARGLPLGVQLVARRHDDHRLLALASAAHRLLGD